MIATLGRPFTRLPCDSAPTVSSCGVSDALNSCAGDGWVVTVTWSLSGSLGSQFEIEVWEKEWEDAESEPGSYSLRARDVTSPYEIDYPDFGSDGDSIEIDMHRKYRIRVVPINSANGAGPFCDDCDTSQLDRTVIECEE